MDELKLVRLGWINFDSDDFVWPALVKINHSFAPPSLPADEPKWTNTFTRDLGPLEFDSDAVDQLLPGEWMDPYTAVRDDQFMTRMIDVYAARLHEHNWRSFAADLWSHNSKENAPALRISVDARNMDLCYKLFSHMYGSTLMSGIQQGFIVEFWCRNYRRIRDWIRLNAYDNMLSFMEFMGVTGMQNPEQGSNMIGKEYAPALDLVFARLAKWGYPGLKFPAWQGSLYALKTHLGHVDARMLQALYMAIKIARKLKNDFNAPIGEIGGGTGYVIYWLYNMGFRNLTIVDLPQISMCQAWMLRQNIGPDVIRLDGETHDAPISLVGPDEFFNKDYALVINSDSLPEMHVRVAHRYLQHIQDHCTWFYSINQEAGAQSDFVEFGEIAQNVVRAEIYRNFPRIELIDRSKFWMRNGYTEEWYHMNHETS
jgi:hypothetical protein